MQYFVFTIIAILFTYFNFKIIINDLKEKKIPNKYLLFLIYILPIYYIYLYTYIWEIEFSHILIQLLLSFIISFILYYYNIWSAWDAKYLLILALFIPNIWIITFIWNIAIITILYLLLYFLYFYFWKCLTSLSYTKSLYKSIYLDLKWKLQNFLKSDDWNFYRNTIIYRLIRWFTFFIIIFIIIRFLRFYVIENYIITDVSQPNYWWIIWFLIKVSLEYHIYLLFVLILVYWSLFLIYKWVTYIKTFFENKFKKNNNSILIDILVLILLSLILWSYIVYEYINDPIKTKEHLKLMFTLYLILYIIVKILIYAYSVTFQIWEEEYIDIKKLKEWTIVDKKYLINLFWEQSILWYCPDETEEKIKKEREKHLLYPNPKKYFLEFKNPISKEDSIKIKEIYEIINDNIKKENNHNIQNIKSIKILKNFWFWWYIFLWFIISFLIWDIIYRYFIDILFEYLKINS